MRRFGAKRDANEAPIVQAVQLAGWKVWQLSAPGLPDLMCVRHGRVVFLEVKDRPATQKKGRLRPLQVDMAQSLASAGLTVHIVRTPEEAIHALRGPEGVTPAR